MSKDASSVGLLAERITHALRTEPSVRAIAFFGSLAEGRADEWSDVDMLVACDGVETAKWAVAAALRISKAVLYYRPFSSAQQPSGRYWFVGESPFHKLDISFDSMEDYVALLQGGGRLGHDITVRELSRKRASSIAATGNATVCPLEITDREEEIGNYIYQSLRSLKRCFRGGEDTRGFEGLLGAANELPAHAVMSGGSIGELVHTVAAMVEHRRDGRPG